MAIIGEGYSVIKPQGHYKFGGVTCRVLRVGRGKVGVNVHRPKISTQDYNETLLLKALETEILEVNGHVHRVLSWSSYPRVKDYSSRWSDIDSYSCIYELELDVASEPGLKHQACSEPKEYGLRRATARTTITIDGIKATLYRKGLGAEIHQPQISIPRWNETLLLMRLDSGVICINNMLYEVLSYEQVTRSVHPGKNRNGDLLYYDLQLASPGVVHIPLKENVLDKFLANV